MEDAILSKLIWVREGSERSRRDILGMLLDPAPLDREFVRSGNDMPGSLTSGGLSGPMLLERSPTLGARSPPIR